jgi:hypothetical protein
VHLAGACVAHLVRVEVGVRVRARARARARVRVRVRVRVRARVAHHVRLDSRSEAAHRVEPLEQRDPPEIVSVAIVSIAIVSTAIVSIAIVSIAIVSTAIVSTAIVSIAIVSPVEPLEQREPLVALLTMTLRPTYYGQ